MPDKVITVNRNETLTIDVELIIKHVITLKVYERNLSPYWEISCIQQDH